MRAMTNGVLAVLLGVGVTACGDGLTFPELPSALLTEFCVRGVVEVGQTVQGSVSDSDCDAADARPGGVGYYEVWRVRVSSAREVTFDANSAFDNYLTLLLLESYTETTADLTIEDENDDRGGGDLNALVTSTLQPDTDYFIAVSGFDYAETGAYTLEVR
jgi:hypothetical protein